MGGRAPQLFPVRSRRPSPRFAFTETKSSRNKKLYLKTIDLFSPLGFLLGSSRKTGPLASPGEHQTQPEKKQNAKKRQTTLADHTNKIVSPKLSARGAEIAPERPRTPPDICSKSKFISGSGLSSRTTSRSRDPRSRRKKTSLTPLCCTKP